MEPGDCDAAEVHYRRLVVVLGIIVSVVVLLALSVTALTFIDRGDDEQTEQVAECQARWDARLRRAAAAYFGAMGEVVAAHYTTFDEAIPPEDKLVTAMHTTLAAYRQGVTEYNEWSFLEADEQVPCPIETAPVPL